MHYLIDGYNLFFYLREEISPLKQTRQTFLQELNDLFASINLVCTIVFDSNVTYATISPSKKRLSSLEILFSPKALSADDYIVEYLLFQTTLQNLTVVTSDRELLRRVRRAGAKTKTINSFFHFVATKKKKQKIAAREKQPIIDSQAEYERLLLMFEKRFEELEDDELL